MRRERRLASRRQSAQAEQDATSTGAAADAGSTPPGAAGAGASNASSPPRGRASSGSFNLLSQGTLRRLFRGGNSSSSSIGLVLAGRFQEQKGRRLLWFLRHSRFVSRLVAASGVLSLAWLTTAGLWLFGATCACLGRPQELVQMETGAAVLYDTALGAWALLLILNTAWLLIPATLVLLLCRCPLAFVLIRGMSGAQGGTMQH